MLERALALAFAVVAVAGSASASTGRFVARAEIHPACKTDITSTTVTLSGCVAHAPYSGTGRGTLDVSYGAKVDILRNRGTQAGTMTIHGQTGHDTLVIHFAGVVTINPSASHGTWSAVSRSGVFARSAPSKGTYSTETPDQGVHVSFDVRG